MVDILCCDFNLLFHCFALKVDGKLYDLKKDGRDIETGEMGQQGGSQGRNLGGFI